MAKRQTFTQAQVTRAIKGVAASGFVPSRAEVLPDGRIVVHIVETDPVASSPFDTWKAKRDAGQTQRP